LVEICLTDHSKCLNVMEMLLSNGISEPVDKLITIMLENQVHISRREKSILKNVWQKCMVSDSTVTNHTVVNMFEKCMDLFDEEIEIYLNEAIRVDIDAAPVTDMTAPCTRLLVVVSLSQKLFTRSLQLFTRYFIECDWNSCLISHFQSFSHTVLSLARNPVLLYPSPSQSLAALLLTHRDLVKSGHKSDLPTIISNLYDRNETSVKVILLQYPEFVKSLQSH